MRAQDALASGALKVRGRPEVLAGRADLLARLDHAFARRCAPAPPSPPTGSVRRSAAVRTTPGHRPPRRRRPAPRLGGGRLPRRVRRRSGGAGGHLPPAAPPPSRAGAAVVALRPGAGGPRPVRSGLGRRGADARRPDPRPARRPAPLPRRSPGGRAGMARTDRRRVRDPARPRDARGAGPRRRRSLARAPGPQRRQRPAGRPDRGRGARTVAPAGRGGRRRGRAGPGGRRHRRRARRRWRGPASLVWLVAGVGRVLPPGCSRRCCGAWASPRITGSSCSTCRSPIASPGPPGSCAPSSWRAGSTVRWRRSCSASGGSRRRSRASR